jgi:rhodanese-related sulfurtransferase
MIAFRAGMAIMRSRPMSPPFAAVRVRDLSVEEVAADLAAGRILLVDVRELHETAQERIPGSTLLPLSAFDLSAIPDPNGREVVFSCRTGVRSVRASEIAQAAGLPYRSHLAGGIVAWKAAGLPTET